MHEAYSVTLDDLLLTCNPALIDVEAMCELIAKQYWGMSRSRRTTSKAIENSLPFVLLQDGLLVGCARVVTDYATIAYLADVIVDEPLRRRGIGQWMIRSIMESPMLIEQHRWLLMTADAQTFYQKIGFAPLEHPEWAMERVIPYPEE
jgi:N-acetylglutamate synthase-like GNAT family acetyltransferase